MKEFYKVKEAKEILQIKSNKEMYKLIKNRSIRAGKLGRQYLIHQEEIDRILVAGRVYHEDKPNY